ncbi:MULTISPECIES: MlaA family lipoprotein [unclassified Marinovum]
MILRAPLKQALAIVGLVLLAGCTLPSPGEVTRDGVFDPYEARNRKVHEASKSLDRAVIRPVALAYVNTVPVPAQDLVTNFASNLSVPGSVVNQVLQADLEGALRNTVRFGLNSTLGFGGIFDVAREFEIIEDDADFSQTLAVWGVPEGAYLELPIFGPATERDAVGIVVDRLIDPLNSAPRPTSTYLSASRITAKFGKRGRFAGSLDSVLYDSADSYAQTRILYLQNRRFEIGGDGETDYIEPDEIDIEGF